MEYASRLHRFLAFVIDFIILIVIGGVLAAIGVITIGVGGDAEEVDTVDGIIQAIIAFGYFVILTVALFGATLGKMAIGMRVVDKRRQQGRIRPRGSSERSSRERWVAILTAVVGAGIGHLVGICRRHHHRHHDPVRREAAGPARQGRRDVRGEGPIASRNGELSRPTTAYRERQHAWCVLPFCVRSLSRSCVCPSG